MQESFCVIPPDLAKHQWENHPHSYDINRANMEMIFHYSHTTEKKVAVL